MVPTSSPSLARTLAEGEERWAPHGTAQQVVEADPSNSVECGYCSGISWASPLGDTAGRLNSMLCIFGLCSQSEEVRSWTEKQ